MPPAMIVHQRIGHLLPVIGVGGIKKPSEAESFLESGIDFVAIGRELIMEPHWLEKTMNGEEDKIATILDTSKKATLNIPDQMLKEIEARPGWIALK